MDHHFFQSAFEAWMRQVLISNYKMPINPTLIRYIVKVGQLVFRPLC